jgi:hypothetical protein
MVLQRASSYGAWHQLVLLQQLLLPQQQQLALLQYLQRQSSLQQPAAARAALLTLAAQAVLQPAWPSCDASLHYCRHCQLLLHHLLQQAAGAPAVALPAAQAVR